MRRTGMSAFSGLRLGRPPARYEKLLSIQQMDAVIRRETSRADRNEHEFSLVLFRVKRTKRHSLSTHRLIKSVMARARGTDEVGWFGDRHICVVLPDTPLAGAWIFADSVCDIAAKRIARPVAIVYCYPGHWFSTRDGAKDSSTLQHPRLAGAELAGRLGDSNGNGDGGRLSLVPQLQHATIGANADDSGEWKTEPANSNHHGHDNRRNGNNGHGTAPATQTQTSAATMEREHLMPYFVTGLNSGLQRGEMTAGSVEMLLARPMPMWKRGLDILGASIGILLTAPLMLIAALGIKLTSPGPIVFTQKRAGLGGRPFTIYKFRTMCTDAEAQKKALRKQSEQDGPAFKMKNDPRITTIGKILRKTSIDELPQLFNVLLGDMSLVGPRPLPVDEAEACQTWQRRRLDVTPGLTCIWQIFGRSTVTFAEWVRMDVAYIRRRTILHDLKLILLTIPAVLMRKGAR